MSREGRGVVEEGVAEWETGGNGGMHKDVGALI